MKTGNSLSFLCIYFFTLPVTCHIVGLKKMKVTNHILQNSDNMKNFIIDKKNYIISHLHECRLHVEMFFCGIEIFTPSQLQIIRVLKTEFDWLLNASLKKNVSAFFP
jgi:hypothetical protein